MYLSMHRYQGTAVCFSLRCDKSSLALFSWRIVFYFFQNEAETLEELQAAHLQLLNKVTKFPKPCCCVEDKSSCVQHEIRSQLLILLTD